MKFAFVICSRLKSNRVPGKALREINGEPCLSHLLKRLKPAGIPIVLACPNDEKDEFSKFIRKYEKRNAHDIHLFDGWNEDPLFRMWATSEAYQIDHLIRITHDKIFVDPDDVFHAIDQYMKNNVDYLYSSNFTDGTGFEIISRKALEKACSKFKNVEHISYAIKAVTDNVLNLDMSHKYESDIRLLIDFPEDLCLMDTVMACLGNDCTQAQVIEFLKQNKWARRINRLPEITVYTCAYNAEKWIEKAMGSVAEQSGFGNFEYLLIDDHSSDRTSFLMAKFAANYRNCSYIRNGRNVGLASSSNVALKNSRGKFIVRLDADDYFTSKTALKELLHTIKERDLDAVYPSNYFGSRGVVQKGDEQHHVGGAIFRTRAINHIKFTEGLRGYEGYDFFGRAKGQIKIGYLNKPLFFYTQRPGSLSHGNPSERELIKSEIDYRLSQMA